MSLNSKASQSNKSSSEDKLQANDAPSHLTPLLSEVRINDSFLSGVIRCYQDARKHIWVKTSDLLAWHMRLPTSKPYLYHGKKLYLLDDQPALSYTFDPYAMQLAIRGPATVFTPQSFDLYNQHLASVDALRPNYPGGFLNYDAVALRNNNPGFNQTNLSALLGLGLFNRFGVGTANILAYNRFSNDITLITAQPNQLLRLDSTWTLDKPEKIASWRFGDAITGSTSWSGAARFGGIQYATNFNTQPNLVTFPLPGYQGEAAVPSTVDILVNSVLNQQRMVNNGPYTFNNIPVVSGAGTVQVVTQDILGRSQVISFPYYASPLLLKPNLVDFSYEVGFIRNNYALESNDYGRALAAATYQRGITDRLTVATHAEALVDQQTLGLSANYLVNRYGVVSLALAGGNNSAGRGGLLALGFIRQGLQLSYGFTATVTSANYLQLGDQPDAPQPSLINQVFFGYSLADYGSLSVTYTLINSREFTTPDSISTTPTARLLTATYNYNLLKNISLNMDFVGDLRNSNTNQVFLGLVFSPDKKHIVSNYSSWQNHQFQDALQFSKPTPLGVGYGYDLFASNNSNRYAGIDFTLQNQIGAYTARLGKGWGQTSYEFDASGSAIYFAGNGYLARKMLDSFGLIQIPGYANVDVFYQNQLMGHTDKKGNLLITGLLPYQENLLKIDPTTLPLDAQINTVEKTVMPYLYSGVLVQFPIQAMQGFVAHLFTPSGHLLPVGAEVYLNSDPETLYTVGYEGELYIPNVGSQSPLDGLVIIGDKHYHFSIDLPKTTDAIIEIGNVICF